MDQQFWFERWERDQIGFHQPAGHPLLHEFWPALELGVDAGVLVPLCGKSRDMAWLAARGHQVIGVELSDKAARAFFAEDHVTPTARAEGGFKCYTANNVEIRVGDLFDLDTATIAGFEAYYDRAALIALPPAMRATYVEHVIGALAPGTRGLLITLDYAQEIMDGPPFAVSEAEVDDLLSPFTEIEGLADRDGLQTHDHLKTRGLETARERVYRIIRR